MRLRLAALLSLFAVTGCTLLGGSGPRAHAGRVTIVTGGTKGVYYSYGVELARLLTERLPGVQAAAVETTGSVDNLSQVASRPDVVAFVAADAAADAVLGNPPFDHPLPVKAIARIYDDFLHLVVRADSPLHSIEDLKGQRVSVGSLGSGTELIANRLLDIVGIDPARDIERHRLSINESVEALENGRIDAFFWSGGIPTTGVSELSDDLAIRLVPLGDLADRMRERFGPVYRAAAVPIGTYGSADQVVTVAVPNYLVTNTATDDGLTYQLLRLLFAHRDELAQTVPSVALLDSRSAISTSPVALHPGALSYFRAVKR